MKKNHKPSITQQAMQALADAVAKVVEDHRRRTRPLAVWRDGKAVWIPATEASTAGERGFKRAASPTDDSPRRPVTP